MDLVEELRNNPEAGARRLETEYKAGLLALARRLCADEGDAEELVNGTFAEVVRSIDRYAEQSAFFGWMARIMIHLNGRKNDRKSNRTVVASEESPDAVADPDADARLFREVDAALLRDAIDGLPADIRKTLVMHCFMDMSVKDVARFLALPVGTVTWRLHYARQMLAAKLGVATRKPGVKMVLLALLLAAGLAAGRAFYTLGTTVLESRAKSAQLESHAESAEPVSHAESAENAESVSHAENAESVSHAESAESAEPTPSTLDTAMNAKSFLAAAIVALAALPAAAVWTPTADSTTSAPKFTDGNFVISWNTNNKQLKYESHDKTVSTVCDMSTFCTDAATAGYTPPNQVAGSGFAGKSGISRVILPEACYGINQQSFSSMADLESVVISSQTRIGGKQAFSSNKKLSTITPHGVAETNGVAFLPETVTSIPANLFQAANSTALKHVIAPGATDLGGDACFQGCNGLETVTVKDLKHIYTLTFQSCYALTNIVVLSRDNPFSGIVSFGGSQQFQSCSSWTNVVNFSEATFTSLLWTL